MNKKILTIMGTFRTGSTFLTKALSAHTNVTVVSDPCFYFFKAFRNEIFLNEHVNNFCVNSPISDNFFSPYLQINDIIKSGDFNIPIKHVKLEKILSNIQHLANNNAPKISQYVCEISVENYKDLFIELLEACRKAYGDSDTTLIGFKDTFVEQFIAPMANTFPGTKCIYLIRDPRAILASQNAYFKKKATARGRYPLLYVVRHWRKSIAYALENIKQGNNIFLVKYEDLTSAPEVVFQKICNYLNIAYDSKILDSSKYKDGNGKTWTQNSAYSTSTKINTKSHEKWKEVLSTEEIQLVEELCSPEMEYLGYKRTTNENPTTLINSAYRDDPTEIDSWLLEFIDEYSLENIHELNKEITRYFFIHHETNNTPINDLMAQKIFIYKDLLKDLPLLKNSLNSF